MEEYQPSEKKLEESIEFYIGRISGTSQVIFILLSGSVLAFIISLAIIKINITVSARGIIRPEAEKSTLLALVPGNVDRILVSEGEPVGAGDTLLVLDFYRLQESMNRCLLRREELEATIADIRLIQAGQKNGLISAGIISAFQQCNDQLDNLKIKLDKAVKERKRLETLYKDNLISEKEYDDLYYQEMVLKKELELNRSTYVQMWQDLLEKYLFELRENRSVSEKLLADIRNHIFIAPVSGFVDQFSGIYPRSTLTVNQPVLTISPDTSLIAEIYLPAGKAGSLHRGQEARILIDAYNYREWGSINSRIYEISNDVMFMDDVPVFRLKCKLDKNVMKLRNGITAELKQGMTCTARFTFSRRTILQLMFDRADRWMRPVSTTKTAGS